jgi:uncharacterized cupin superfamily protein
LKNIPFANTILHYSTKVQQTITTTAAATTSSARTKTTTSRWPCTAGQFRKQRVKKLLEYVTGGGFN